MLVKEHYPISILLASYTFEHFRHSFCILCLLFGNIKLYLAVLVIFDSIWLGCWRSSVVSLPGGGWVRPRRVRPGSRAARVTVRRWCPRRTGVGRAARGTGVGGRTVRHGPALRRGGRGRGVLRRAAVPRAALRRALPGGCRGRGPAAAAAAVEGAETSSIWESEIRPERHVGLDTASV